MKKELEDELRKDFPLIFKELRCFGIGGGWEPLIRRTAQSIEAYLSMPIKNDALGQHITSAQIKEKFGGLRWYITEWDDHIENLIKEAEKEAWKTCEECGKPGVLRQGEWLKTLCDEHAGDKKPYYRMDDKDEL